MYRCTGDTECLDIVSDHINRSAILLQSTAYGQKRFHANGVAVPFIDIGPHDDIDRPMFILYQHEDVPLGGTWSLTCRDKPCNTHCAPLSKKRKPVGGQGAFR